MQRKDFNLKKFDLMEKVGLPDHSGYWLWDLNKDEIVNTHYGNPIEFPTKKLGEEFLTAYNIEGQNPYSITDLMVNFINFQSDNNEFYEWRINYREKLIKEIENKGGEEASKKRLAKLESHHTFEENEINSATSRINTFIKFLDETQKIKDVKKTKLESGIEIITSFKIDLHNTLMEFIYGAFNHTYFSYLVKFDNFFIADISLGIDKENIWDVFYPIKDHLDKNGYQIPEIKWKQKKKNQSYSEFYNLKVRHPYFIQSMCKPYTRYAEPIMGSDFYNIVNNNAPIIESGYEGVFKDFNSYLHSIYLKLSMAQKFLLFYLREYTGGSIISPVLYLSGKINSDQFAYCQASFFDNEKIPERIQKYNTSLIRKSGELTPEEIIKKYQEGYVDYQNFLRLGNSVESLKRAYSDPHLSRIKRGERQNVEFKESYAYNIHSDKIDKKLKTGIVKEIAAFLNTDNGGFLYIGVSDEGASKGVNYEKEQCIDAQELRRIIMSSIHGAFQDQRGYSRNLIQIDDIKINGKDIIYLRVTRADVYVGTNKAESPESSMVRYYQRVDSMSMEIGPTELIQLQALRAN